MPKPPSTARSQPGLPPILKTSLAIPREQGHVIASTKFCVPSPPKDGLGTFVDALLDRHSVVIWRERPSLSDGDGRVWSCDIPTSAQAEWRTWPSQLSLRVADLGANASGPDEAVEIELAFKIMTHGGDHPDLDHGNAMVRAVMSLGVEYGNVASIAVEHLSGARGPSHEGFEVT
jgi:hypothetical protein